MVEQAVVLGLGEVGSALATVLSDKYVVWGCEEHGKYLNWPHRIQGCGAHQLRGTTVHVCFPWSEEFVDEVARYAEELAALRVIIHSSVPVGTTAKCREQCTCPVVHSPVIGLHPGMEESLRVFTKFVGGPDSHYAAEHLRRAGLRVFRMRTSEATEVCKLYSTLFYGTCIEFAREVDQRMEEVGAPYEAWLQWTAAYNEGYALLGRPEVHRPSLSPPGGEIGGHCVRENAALVGSRFADIVRGRPG